MNFNLNEIKSKPSGQPPLLVVFLLLVFTGIHCSAKDTKKEIQKTTPKQESLKLGKIEAGWYVNEAYKIRLPTVKALRMLKDVKTVSTVVENADKIGDYTYQVKKNPDGLLYTFGFQHSKDQVVDTAFSVDYYDHNTGDKMARAYVEESMKNYFQNATKQTLPKVPVASLTVWPEKQPVYFSILRLPLEGDALNYYVAVMPIKNLLIATSGQFLDSKIQSISDKQKDSNSLALYLSVALWENGELTGKPIP